VLDGVLAWFCCTISGIHPGGDHEVVTAEVRSLDATDSPPLVFHRGRFGAVTGIEIA
jgi:flavin reductase (DIM6/NTAB) family NADH-FMN oxidoreductase RutF